MESNCPASLVVEKTGRLSKSVMSGRARTNPGHLTSPVTPDFCVTQLRGSVCVQVEFSRCKSQINDTLGALGVSCYFFCM